MGQGERKESKTSWIEAVCCAPGNDSCHLLGNRNGVGESVFSGKHLSDKLCGQELAGLASQGLAVPRETGKRCQVVF